MFIATARSRVFGLLFICTFCFINNCQADQPLRAGIIGCDTSHCVRFTKMINAPDATGYTAKVKVTSAFPGGSNDMPISRDRVDGFVKELRGLSVNIVDSIEELIAQVDVVLLESVDGRVHLEQVRPVLAARKAVFIDKPLAASLSDAVEIGRLADASGVPWFSCSALRFSPAVSRLSDDKEVGSIIGCSVFAPCDTEPHHSDLFWYGIHGIEALYALMGPGCVTVSRVHTDGTDVVVGVWSDGRIGSYRGLRDGKREFGFTVFGKDKIVTDRGHSYQPLVETICKFFVTGKPPLESSETLEIFAFMEAAAESKRQGGAPISILKMLKDAGYKKITEAP